MAPIKKKTDKVVNNPYRVKRCAMKVYVIRPKPCLTYTSCAEAMSYLPWLNPTRLHDSLQPSASVASSMKPIGPHDGKEGDPLENMDKQSASKGTKTYKKQKNNAWLLLLMLHN